MNTVNTIYRLLAEGERRRDHTEVPLTYRHQFPEAVLSKFRIFICLLFGLIIFGGKVSSQTNFAPGQIMFIGYASDPAVTPPPYGAFSIVLLTDVVNGTVIYITDRGWSNTTGFRNDTDGEGTISFTFTANYSCGTEFIFSDLNGTNDWQAKDINGNVVGTVVIQARGDGDGMELGTAGDQLIIYQLPEPTVGNQTSFICMIQMDNGYTSPLNTDDESEIPAGLSESDVVRFNLEVDDAKYNCSPNAGQPLALRAAISNYNGAGGLKPDASNGWTESQNFLSLTTACNFCCGYGAPPLSAPSEVTTNQTFTITINGSLPPGASWQLYTAGCGSGAPLQVTMTNSFTVTAPGSTGNVTYYVRPSTDPNCTNSCGTVNVCVVANLVSLCTDCFANMGTCGLCFLPNPTSNPELNSGCFDIKLIFVLDESGSVAPFEADVRAGVLAFLNALNGQNIEVALIEFSDLGRLVNNYTIINNAYINNIANYFDNVPYPGSGQWYAPSGGTNWHDAMIRVDALDPADMVLFFTDGEPTVWTQANGIPSDCGNGGSTQPPEIVNPVKIANKIKGEGTHMFMLGVGTGINQLNLERMSGFTQYVSGFNTIGTSDYSIGQFSTLANDLAAFVSELCRTELDFDKQVVGSVCNGVQQFRFIIHNPGTESAATVVEVKDTFPNGFNNIQYYGPPNIKFCVGMACWPLGYNAPDNAFRWTTNSVPPGGSDTLDLFVNVLSGMNLNYTNIGWAQGSNTFLASDTTTSSNLSDDLDPTIMCPSNITISCTEVTLPSHTGDPIANDPDGAPPVVTHTDITIAGLCPQEYTITRRWTATDGCQNTATCNQIIVIDDNAAPMMTCPADITLNCTDNTLPANTGIATGTDNCSTIAITSSDDVIGGSCPQESTIRRTWRATDACGNSSTCLQTIIVDDAVPPMITCPSNVTVQCYSNTLPAETGNATATDVCDSSPLLIYNDMTIQGPLPNGYSIMRTWNGADDCGNSSTCVQTITVQNPLVPGITGDAFDTICSGETVMFQGMNQGFGAVMYQWNFGSGASPPTATGIGPHNVTYTYNGTNGTVGAYVLLTVSLTGCASVTDTVANVHVNPIPNPAIDAPTSNLCYYTNRTFKPVAMQIPGYTYHWDFGSGASIPPISGYGPHHVKYTTTGAKTVQLIVNSNAPGASCSDTATITFTVIACPGNIAGKVRKQDGTGIGSVQLKLYTDNNLDGLPEGNSLQTANTLSTGVYNFLNIVPGQYVIVETQPTGYTSISEMDETNDFDTIVYNNPNDNILPVTIEPSEIDRDNVFVEEPSPGIITGFVFQDLNSNQVPESGEGIFEATVNLYTDVEPNGIPDVGGFISSVMTSALGYYEFGNVTPGNYVLWENQPAGYSNLSDFDLTNDSDNVPNTNTTNDIIPVTIVLGETDADNYFTENQTCGHIVTNTNDGGPGSFRYVVNCLANGDTITFHPFLQNQVIHLTSGRIVFDKNLVIHSSLTPRVRIQSDISGAFMINTGKIVEFKNINVTSGLSGNFGAAFENYGNLTLWDMDIFKNNLLLPGNYLIYNSTTGLLTVKGGIQIEGN